MSGLWLLPCGFSSKFERAPPIFRAMMLRLDGTSPIGVVESVKVEMVLSTHMERQKGSACDVHPPSSNPWMHLTGLSIYDDNPAKRLLGVAQHDEHAFKFACRFMYDDNTGKRLLGGAQTKLPCFASDFVQVRQLFGRLQKDSSCEQGCCTGCNLKSPDYSS